MKRFLYIAILSFLSLSVSAKVTLTPYLADSSINTGIAVIICPGGSYSWHDMDTEGKCVAMWLQQNGINAFVLKYRVATVPAYIFGFRILGIGNKYPDMLTDVEWALQEVYSKAADYNLDTTMIGVMGFSAGGHLTMMSFTHNRTKFKPSFLCPIYPVVTMSEKKWVHRRSRRGALGVWRQFNKQMQDSLSLERHIPDSCPPVFLVNCIDDPVVKYYNSVLLDSALTAKGINHKYIQYNTGGHGFGASDTKGTDECRNWKKEFILWISNLKALRK